MANFNKDLITNNANAFALTFAFAPSHTGIASKVKSECKPSHLTMQIFLQTQPDTARNVTRFGESVCELETTHLRTDSRAAHNIGLNEILKMEVLTVIRTVVLLTTSCGNTNSCASNPPFLKNR